MIDLAGVVGVVGDHRRRGSSGSCRSSPQLVSRVRVELRVVGEGRDMARTSRCVRRLEPGRSRRPCGAASSGHGSTSGVAPLERPVREGIVGVHDLARRRRASAIERDRTGGAGRQRRPGRSGTVARCGRSAWLRRLLEAPELSLEVSMADPHGRLSSIMLEDAVRSVAHRAILEPRSCRRASEPGLVLPGPRVDADGVAALDEDRHLDDEPGLGRRPACAHPSACRRRSRAPCRRPRGRP